MLSCPPYYDKDINDLIQTSARTFKDFGLHDGRLDSGDFLSDRPGQLSDTKKTRRP